MSSVNKVILVGNLGKDPEVRRMNNGDQVCSFSVATSERWRDKASGEMKERAHWHNIVIFSENLVKVADMYLKKGSKVYLEGSLQTRKWTDQAGVEKYTTEVVLKNFNGELVLLDGRKADESVDDFAAAPKPRQGNRPAARDDDSEIPF